LRMGILQTAQALSKRDKIPSCTLVSWSKRCAVIELGSTPSLEVTVQA
jgi:hypothetical protein